MHGVLLCELRSFAVDAVGADGWAAILRDTGLDHRDYRPAGAYPDEELAAIARAVADRAGVPLQDLLEAFGRFIVPDLLAGHASLVAPGWRTLDLLEHVEDSVHAVVRRDDPQARPPRLRSRRTAPNEVRIVYASRRALCSVARGIVHGVAGHYGDRVTVEEPTCTRHGDAACELVIRLAAAEPAAPAVAGP